MGHKWLNKAGGRVIMVLGCRLIGRVGVRWGTNKWAGSFCDAKLGFGLVQLVNSVIGQG